MDESTLESMLIRINDTKPPEKPPSDWAPCNAGANMAMISPYGQVFPCVQLRKEAGNIKYRKFRHIWRNSPVLRKVRNVKIEDSTECLICKYAEWCVRCPGMALVETGSMYAPSPIACKEARLRKKAALALVSGKRR
jgi:radical SAM protein with 4Fe4S-binding SPASM domain